MTDGFADKFPDGMPANERLVTIFGGSGFIGRHVVRELANRGWRVRVACRRPDLAFFLQPLGRVGQVAVVQANVRVPASVAAALRGADAVVNLVGVLAESGRQSFEAVHAFGAGAIGRAATEAGIRNVVHVSAIGADAESPAAYARTKARGEAAIREAAPETIIFRPSVVFGPEDGFFNRFAAMARIMPVLPLVGADTKFQPVFVGDVATAIADAVDGKARAGATYELGGPEIATFRDLVAYVCDITGRKRLLASLPFGAGRGMALGTEILSKLSLGLFPEILTTTRDQVEMLRTDNVVSEAAKAEGRTLEGLGVEPESFRAIAPTYLWRYRATGQYDSRKLA
ncbi:MAG TPA: complex I NDUFA9 subunit family protein [Rhodoblastus sp.]|nr:complex I NDUFA9 subunit family protein [Rhodoblastus sp.]